MTRARIAAIPLAFVVAGGLAACSLSSIEILGVIGDTNSNRLQLSLDSCNQNPKATVEETVTEVRIEVTGDSDTGEDCADAIAVTLDSPLGDRRVIDESTGDEVRVGASFNYLAGSLQTVGVRAPAEKRAVALLRTVAGGGADPRHSPDGSRMAQGDGKSDAPDG